MQTNFGATYGNNRKYCKRCQKYCDHTERLCNEYLEWICPLCAGRHLATDLCPLQVCSTCGQNHLDSKCKIKASKLKCTICNINGHSDEMCINNWKLYHSVTSINDLNQIKPPKFKSSNMVCVQCGSRQHWTFKCSNLKNTSHYYNPAPSSKAINRIKERMIDRMKALNDSIEIELNNEVEDDVIDLEFEIDNECKSIDKKLSSKSAETNKDEFNQLESLESNQDNQPIDDDLINEQKSKRIKTQNKSPSRFVDEISASKMTQIIDKNIKSEAIKFNAITMKNVHHFLPRESNSRFKKIDNQPTTSYCEERPDNKIKNKLILKSIPKRQMHLKSFKNKKIRISMKKAFRSIKKKKLQKKSKIHLQTSISNKIKSKQY